MGKRGPKPHQPTEKARAVVRALAGFGIPGEEIAHHPEVRVSLSTLHKYYRDDLDEGNAMALGRIGKRLFEKAMNGDTAALIFLAKTRIGLRETSVMRLANADGNNLDFTFNLDAATDEPQLSAAVAGAVSEEGPVH